MKNLLNLNDFKNRYKNLTPITESMDMSNNTGWSSCLVGRFVNKLFSSGTKKVYQLILNKLSKKLSDEYLKGILIALAESNIAATAISGKNSNIDFDVNLINKTDENDILTSDMMENEFHFKLPENKKREEYKLNIVIGETSTLEPKVDDNTVIEEKNTYNVTAENGDKKEYLVYVKLFDQKDNNVNIDLLLINKNKSDEVISYDIIGDKYFFNIQDAPITDYKIIATAEKDTSTIDPNNPDGIDAQAEMKFKVTAENGKFKEYVITIGQQSVATVPKGELATIQEPTSIEVYKVDDNKGIDENVQKQIDYIKTILKGLNSESLSAKDSGGLILVKNLLETEISKVTNEEKKKALSDLKEEINKKINWTDKEDITEEQLLNYKNELKEYSTLNSKLETIKGMFTDKESEKIISKLTRRAALIHPDSKHFGDNKEKMAAFYDKINKVLDNIITAKSMKDVKVDSIATYDSDNKKFITESYKYDLYFEELNNLFDEILNSENLNEAKISTILSNKKLSKNIKNIDNLYGEINLEQLDPKLILEEFKKNPKLKQLAIDRVNQEALKEIQLRAEWLYDSEKNKDTSSEVYTRVNFTVTKADTNKLLNVWLKKVANIKAVYTPFFANEQGFPQKLDPIALVRSDETFRKNYNQYTKENGPEQSQNLGNMSSVNNTSDPDILKRVGLVDLGADGLKDSQTGIFEIVTDQTNIRMGLVLSAIQKDGIMMFTFVGLVDYKKIYDEINANQKATDDEISKIIEKHNYISTRDKIRSILDVKVDDENLRKQIIEIYKAYSPKPDPKYKSSTNNFLTFFTQGKQNMIQGVKKMIQITIVTDASYNVIETSVSDTTNRAALKYEKIDTMSVLKDNSGIITKYIFTFNIKNVFRISKYNLWNINNDTLNVKISDKYIRNDNKIIDKIKSLLKIT